ncbi:hypothetical protein AMR72_17580 [Flavobacterium psychrophilum]|nr:hypothetical protein AMR72_17580 [Flavobacterium psychrophilum]AOE54154.1 hypothetical protein ALW18_17565 [Flavobacterium psychrophilum]
MGEKDGSEHSAICIINQTLSELDALESSSQLYNLIEKSSDVGSGASGNVQYSNGKVNVNIAGSFSMGLFGRELKHAYQFESGSLSFNLSNGNGGVLYDLQDEVEAYNRGSFFGEARQNLANIKVLYPGIQDRTTQRTLDTPTTPGKPHTYRNSFEFFDKSGSAMRQII